MLNIDGFCSLRHLSCVIVMCTFSNRSPEKGDVTYAKQFVLHFDH
jgi:hypothetical protein